MIIDHISHIRAYAGLNSAFAKAAEWLLETDLETLPCGQYQIDGDNVFATLSENRLSAGKPKFEAHKRYADIQLIVKGKERFLYRTKARILEPEPGTDFYPCEAVESVEYLLESGMFTVFLPGEAHSPGNSTGEVPDLCCKLVIKVLCSFPD